MRSATVDGMRQIHQPQTTLHIPAISGDSPDAETVRHYNERDSATPEAGRSHRRRMRPDAPEWQICCPLPHADEAAMLAAHTLGRP